MAYIFTPVATVNFTGADVNPLPAPWVSYVSQGGAVLQQKSNKCIGTVCSPTNGVSAMGYPLTPTLAEEYAAITIASLVNDVDTETSIDVWLRANATLTSGYSVEVSKSDAGGYHFDCVCISDDSLVFSQDFTQKIVVGDVVLVALFNKTVMVYVNGILMIQGASDVVEWAGNTSMIIQLNSAVVQTDPAISAVTFGRVTES